MSVITQQDMHVFDKVDEASELVRILTLATGQGEPLDEAESYAVCTTARHALEVLEALKAYINARDREGKR